MLKIVLMEDPQSRREFLSGFQPERECLLVPDIKTKLSAERLFLEKGLCLSGASVLRIHEFFKELFYLLPPERELVSDLFFEELFAEFAQSHSSPLLKNLQNSRRLLLSCLNQFLPIFLHPEGAGLMEEWFQEKGRPAAARWRLWHQLAREFFQFAEERKIIHESGLKGLLAHKIPFLDSPPFGGKKIIADLGMSCDPCEQFILKEISLKTEVTVLAPRLKQKGFYGDGEDVYSRILSEAPPQQVSSFEPAAESPSPKAAAKGGLSGEKPRPLFFRETSLTQLREVKTAVAQVRQWLERGVPETDIEILAPDMEAYWFCLKPHLEREGIRAEKSSFARFQDFPDGRRWLSAMRLHLPPFRFSDLEHFSFYKEPRADFSEFQAAYFHVPERELSKKRLRSPRKIKEGGKKARGREFIEWAWSLWPKPGDRALLELARKALQSLPLEGELSWGAWLRLLEKAVFSLEKETEREVSGGALCLSFNALQSARGSHAAVMGLDEDSLKIPLPAVLAWEDRKSLVSDLGFHLPFPHQETRERALLWRLQSSRLKEACFSFAEADFSGKPQNPSLFFVSLESMFSLSERKSSEKAPAPERLTVWDSQKRQPSIGDIWAAPKRKKPPGKAPSAAESFKENQAAGRSLDKSHAEESPILEKTRRRAKLLEKALTRRQRFFQKSAIELSVRRLQLYDECGFRYAAEYIFGSGQDPLIDRELSPMRFGGLAHECFGEFLRGGPLLDRSQQEIEEFVERFKPEERDLAHKSQWPVVKSVLTGILGKFQKEERERQSLFPRSSSETEKAIEAFWSKKSGRLKRKGDYPFKGRMDRIDCAKTGKSYFLMDYKAADSAMMTHIKSWQTDKKSDLQLLLYAQALEEGLVEDMPPGRVQALAYYSYRDFGFKGYAEKGSPLENVFGKKSFARQPREAFEKALEKALLRVQEGIEGIENGLFFARPKDEKTCETCFARKWCRAEHLK